MPSIIAVIFRHVALLLLLLLVVFFSAVIPDYFLNTFNILNVLRQVSVEALLAFGLTLTLIVRGIDLSVGSVLGMAAALSMGLQPLGVGIACTTALLCGAAVGTLNGWLITRVKLLPFIVTLGTMTLVRGLTLLYSREPIGGRVEWFTFFGDGRIGWLPVPIIILFGVALFFHILLRYTRFGRNLYATGGGERAAHLAGINTDFYKFMAYIISGLTASAGGVLLSSRLNSSSPNIGVGLELEIIAAAIIGGASLLGGRGTIPGTLFGVLVLGVLSNGMDLMGVFSYYQIVITGLVLIAVVVLDANYRPGFFKHMSVGPERR